MKREQKHSGIELRTSRSAPALARTALPSGTVDAVPGLRFPFASCVLRGARF